MEPEKDTRELLIVAGRAGMGKSSLVKLLCPHSDINIDPGQDHCTL